MRTPLSIFALALLLSGPICILCTSNHCLAEGSKEPNSTATNFTERAKRKFEAGDLQGALLDLDSAVKSEPNSASSYLVRAFCKNSLRDFNGALADCNQAITHAPNSAAAYLQRAITEYHIRNVV